MTQSSPSGRGEVANTRTVHNRGYALAVTLIAVILAGLAFFFSPKLLRLLSPWALALLIGLAFLGFSAGLGWLSGYVRIGRKSPALVFFDGLFDAVGDALVVTDKNGRAIYGNSHYIKLLSKAGFSRLVGVDILYAGQSSFIEPIYQLSQAALEGQAEFREIRIPAGSSVAGADRDISRWVKLCVSPVYDHSKRQYLLWRLQDITVDRSRQEHAFGRLQFIINYLDRAPAGFFSTLANGKVDYVNVTLANWLGFDVAESQAGELRLVDLLGEEGARQIAAIEPVTSGGKTEFFTLKLKSREGQILPVEVIHRIDFDAQGEMLPARTMVIPQQERSHDEPAHDILEKFAANAPIGVVEVDGKGVITSANDAMLAISPQVKRGARLEDMVIEADRPGLRDSLVAARQSLNVIDCDATIQDHKPRLLRFSALKLSPQSERLTLFALDKTESKALEVQLAQSQKMQAVGQLASGIAHDFNNVLTPIIGFADLLLAKMRPTDPAFADIMNIKQNANRAANLVRQLLAFSRKQTLQAKVHSLTDTMADLGNLLGRVLGEKIELKVNHSRDLGLVMVDINQFEQVIINLVVNARDAMPKGGTLNVRTRNVSLEESRGINREPMPPGEYVVCEVSDTGTGIPPEILSKIWEPFFSTKDVGKGTGLGLSTVYGIVKQTGGFIFCDSELGKGTTFSIYLPRYYPPAQTAEPVVVGQIAVKKEERSDHTGNGRILLVEDEDAVRAFAVRALTSRGYTITEADSGESALAIIEESEEGFDLILSDVVMPEMDGPTLLRELRKRGIQTKVIFVSGYAEDAFEKNLEGQTDFAFLPKPFSLKQLVEKVKEVMP